MTSHAKPVAAGFGSLAEFAPDWTSLPGDTIAELMDERGWTQTELAQRTSYTPKHINQLLKGEAAITQDTAIKLEKVLGSTARFWLGLESQYREQLARQNELDSLAQEGAWLKKLPLTDMIRFGWVRKFSDTALQVQECLRFWAVSSVAAWELQYQKPVAAYRAAPRLTRTPEAVSAWLRQAERLADGLRCEDFDKGRFEQALAQARVLSQDRNPKVFLPKLQVACASAGVAVVISPAPTGCPVSGATKWLSPKKALIVLSVRGKSDDKLWFTFFHEAGHLLKHGKSLTFLDILGEDGLNAQEEAEADAFARDFLIPPRAFALLRASGRMGESLVRSFATQQQIAPGIVVGRLQHEGLLPWTHLNFLKIKYEWLHDR